MGRGLERLARLLTSLDIKYMHEDCVIDTLLRADYIYRESCKYCPFLTHPSLCMLGLDVRLLK